MTLHFLKDQREQGKEEGKCFVGEFPPTPPARPYWSLSGGGDRDPSSLRSYPQIIVIESLWGTLGKEHLLCERVGKCGSNP